MDHDTARAVQHQYGERVTEISVTNRPPTCWINYRGNVVPDPEKPMGPNLLGELLWPVDVQPNVPHDGWTCVGFSTVAPSPGALANALGLGPDALALAAAGR